MATKKTKAESLPDFKPEDFDADGNLINSDHVKAQDDERKKLLGQPVSSGLEQFFPDNPPPAAEVDSTVNPPKAKVGD